MKNLILIGMPGSGKSTVGVILAKTLAMDFVDIDLLICRREGCGLQTILDERGLDAFLQVEQDTVLEHRFTQTVVATGGSVVLEEAAMEHLHRDGRFVFLDVSLPELERRITNIRSRGIAFRPGQTLAQLYEERRPLYCRWADITISVPDGHDMTEAVVEAIVKQLK